MDNNVVNLLKIKKNMKKILSQKCAVIIIACISLMFGADCFAGIEYKYDAAGNRVLRENKIPMQAKRFVDAAEEQTTDIFEEELAEMKITIFPNPTKGLLQVKISNAETLQGTEILLYNPQGTLIKRFGNLSELTTLDISSQPDGIYIMQIVSGKNIISTWKIIKN